MSSNGGSGRMTMSDCVRLIGNLMGAAVQDIINGGLTNLIKMPVGCGEQTMMRMAPTVYVLRYLLTLKNAVTSEIETKAYSFIRQGLLLL